MIILISGPIAVGKTAVGEALASTLGGPVIRVRQALADVLGIEPEDRLELQRRGAELDASTAGRWLRDYIEERHGTDAMLIVDSLRTRLQSIPVLESLVDSRLVYLHAHEETRRARYNAASVVDVVKASVPYDTAMNHPTEIQVRELIPLAHMVIDTDDLSPEAVAGVILDSLPAEGAPITT